MTIDSRTFRQTVGHFVTGVTVIAIEVDGAVRGMTANAFTSLSLDPPLVLFCVKKKAHLGELIHSAKGFSVNILGQAQQDLSVYFAGAWKESTPPAFAFEPWEGGPRLNECVAALGCAVEHIYEGGDHWIVIGRVLSVHRREPACAPLVFAGGRYFALAEPVETP
jgi:flavin reductase (DIM6/NTAB) family NADH-FMN oxidoreductase RutF